MTQALANIENDANENITRRILESASLSHPQEDEGARWLESIHNIKDSIDPSVIDMYDPRTNYIMTKHLSGNSKVAN